MTAESDGELTRLIGEEGTVRTAFDQMPMIMAVYSGAEHTVVAANDALRSFFGRDELVGLPIRRALPELAGQHIFELLDEVFATGRSRVAREWRLQVDPGGTGELKEVFLDFHMAPSRDPQGEISGVLTYAADVTEQVVARQAAQDQAAAAEARYRDARSVVTALQEALLPTALPVLPGAALAARYLVAGRDQVAGGDWFDAVPGADGTVALVVGDVVGHGVAASAAMGQLRAVLGDALATGDGGAEALARADAFAARNPLLRATTVAVVVLDPASGALRYSTCGQPPPLVIGVDGTTRFLEDTATGPLGTGSPPRLAEDVLGPGELVLLYSDGLIERPHRTLADGMAELAKVAADAAANRSLPKGAAPSPEERVCQLTVELLTRTGYDDDVTVLAAYRRPAAVGGLSLDVSTVRAELRQLRRELDDWLDGLRPVDTDREAIELAVWEAVANAVDHAYPPGETGPVRLDAELGTDGVLECRVRDSGRWRAPDPSVTYRGRGLLMAEQLVDVLQVRPASPDGPAGTQVTLRHRLRRPAMLVSSAIGDAGGPADRPPFGLDVDPADGQPRVRVRGPVDVLTAEDLRRELSSASRGGVLSLSVDLSGVTLLASAGVQELHRTRDQLAAHGRSLLLRAPTGSVSAAVLDLVHLEYETGTSLPALG